MTGKPAADRSLPRLTSKQREVLALVADNRTSKEIAALLDISESAVNQRIEIVRSRLGGLPRGELARLYRQELAPNSEPEAAADPTWQKIHLPDSATHGDGERQEEGIFKPEAVGSRQMVASGEDGSQLSSYIYGTAGVRSDNEGPGQTLIRGGMMVFIVLAALLIAAGITQALAAGVPAG